MKDVDVERVIKSVIIKIVGITGTIPDIESRKVDHEGQRYLHMNIGVLIDDEPSEVSE